MARKRMIDPSIWQDEGMAELTPRQQLLYVGLFSNADDEGRLKGSPAAVALMLPAVYRGADLCDVAADLAAVVATMGQLVAYEAAGKPYLAFRNYRRWQKIDKPTESELPAPPDPFAEDSPSPPRALAPNRTEEKRTEGNPPPPREALPPRTLGEPMRRRPNYADVLNGAMEALEAKAGAIHKQFTPEWVRSELLRLEEDVGPLPRDRLGRGLDLWLDEIGRAVRNGDAKQPRALGSALMKRYLWEQANEERRRDA